MNHQQSNTKKISLEKKKTCRKKTVQQPKKRKTKLTRAQYDDLRQIEWVPFDPYAD